MSRLQFNVQDSFGLTHRDVDVRTVLTRFRAAHQASKRHYEYENLEVPAQGFEPWTIGLKVGSSDVRGVPPEVFRPILYSKSTAACSPCFAAHRRSPFWWQ
jgi:hypothetical protein